MYERCSFCALKRVRFKVSRERWGLQVRRVKRAALADIETRSLPTLTRCFSRSFTFYVVFPIHSIAGLLPRRDSKLDDDCIDGRSLIVES